MLSRVADNLYWMSRYLERAEHTARLIDVTLQQMLDQTTEDASSRWVRLLESLHIASLADETNGAYDITQGLTFDVSNRSSIVSCIATAQENARQVREQISSEMWEQLNRLFLEIKRTGMEEIWHAGLHQFFASVKEGVHLFQGITDATMSHSEGCHFIRDRHIRVAIGRDYTDVPPTRGVFRGKAQSELIVAVKVFPSDAPLSTDLPQEADWIPSNVDEYEPELESHQQQPQQQQQ
jgi:hypothetical protein